MRPLFYSHVLSSVMLSLHLVGAQIPYVPLSWLSCPKSSDLLSCPCSACDLGPSHLPSSSALLAPGPVFSSHWREAALWEVCLGSPLCLLVVLRRLQASTACAFNSNSLGSGGAALVCCLLLRSALVPSTAQCWLYSSGKGSTWNLVGYRLWVLSQCSCL